MITVFFVIMMILNNLKTPLKETILNEEKSSFDISNPSFTINNGGEKISVKAKRGKFLNNAEIVQLRG